MTDGSWDLKQTRAEGMGSGTPTPAALPKPVLDALAVVRMARAAILEKKGEKVVVVDVRGVSTVTDYYVIASVATPPHLKAVLTAVQQRLKEAGTHSYRKSGSPEHGWMVIDYVDVVIHIFLTELREYYALEELWAQSPQVK